MKRKIYFWKKINSKFYTQKDKKLVKLNLKVKKIVAIFVSKMILFLGNRDDKFSKFIENKLKIIYINTLKKDINLKKKYTFF